jgi:hypothetical protein
MTKTTSSTTSAVKVVLEVEAQEAPVAQAAVTNLMTQTIRKMIQEDARRNPWPQLAVHAAVDVFAGYQQSKANSSQATTGPRKKASAWMSARNCVGRLLDVQASTLSTALRPVALAT